MQTTKTKERALLAILTALSLVLAHVILPTPTGFVTLLDVGVFFTAFYLGGRQGAIVGGLAGFLIDLLLGYPQYMVFSLLAHGLQGYFAGFSGKKQSLDLVLASLVMVGVYAVAALVLGYGFPAAVASIPTNLAQNLVGMALGYALYRLLKGRLPF
ncbi:ECF transporter S component [Streptococcus caprae]|uniref:ECF transporter S component n=1 Tax=Streptococcus caprae TaxID=1640501 RepID=A0ABV8CUG6_9STRE